MNILDLPFDDDQRRAMADRHDLVVIAGGAGCGRTHALLGRCADLLDDDRSKAAGAAAQVLVRSPGDARRAQDALSGVRGCRVDTVAEFCARLFRPVARSPYTLLSDREAVDLLARGLSGSWTAGGPWEEDSAVLRRRDLGNRATRALTAGEGSGSGWNRYVEECRRWGLYDRWLIVRSVVEVLSQHPELVGALRGGACRWLLADDVHRWTGWERRLLEVLSAGGGSMSLSVDTELMAGQGVTVQRWMADWWDGDVSPHHLELCHRSDRAICRFLGVVRGRQMRWHGPEGERPVHIRGDTPGDSAALAAEQIAEWMGRGLDANDVAMIDLAGGGVVDDVALQLARVGHMARRTVDWDIEAADARAMLRLAVNPWDAAALSSSWRHSDGGPQRVDRRMIRPLEEESNHWNSDLMAAAATLAARGQLKKTAATWLGDLLECQRTLIGCLDGGGGVGEVLDRRRRRVFDTSSSGSDRFSDLVAWVSELEQSERWKGAIKAGLAQLLDALALREDESDTEGGVAVLGVREAAGGEWPAVCVINAVRSEDGSSSERRMDLYEACSRAQRSLAVCDYRRDYLGRAAISLWDDVMP